MKHLIIAIIAILALILAIVGFSKKAPAPKCTCTDAVACDFVCDHADCAFVAAAPEIPCDGPVACNHAECAYVEAQDEIPCNFVCDHLGGCAFVEAEDPVDCDALPGCFFDHDPACGFVEGVDCLHDGGCSFVEAVPEVPCDVIPCDHLGVCIPVVCGFDPLCEGPGSPDDCADPDCDYAFCNDVPCDHLGGVCSFVEEIFAVACDEEVAAVACDELPGCVFVHDGDCEFAEEVIGVECDTVHVHDDDCGFVAAVIGVECDGDEACDHEDCAFVAAVIGVACDAVCDHSDCAQKPAFVCPNH